MIEFCVEGIVLAGIVFVVVDFSGFDWVCLFLLDETIWNLLNASC